MLVKDTENFRHAHEYIDAVELGTQSAEWIINNYAYGHANTALDTLEGDPETSRGLPPRRPERPRGAECPLSQRYVPRPRPLRDRLGRGQGRVGGASRREWPSTDNRSYRPAPPVRGGAGTAGPHYRRPARPAGAWLVLFFLVPVVLIAAAYCVNVSLVLPGRAVLHPRRLEELSRRLALTWLFWKSVQLSLIVSIAAVVFAYPIAYFLALVASKRKYVLLLLILPRSS